MTVSIPPTELIIGANGRIGSALFAQIPVALRTTRRDPKPTNNLHFFDLLNPSTLADADIVYLCAGVNGAKVCAGDPWISYRTNVDGTLWVANWCRDHGAFLVWLSSTTVEWQTDHYGSQKRIAETVLRVMPHVGIIRAGRVLTFGPNANIDDLCKLMISIGRARKPVLELFAEDEQPYSEGIACPR